MNKICLFIYVLTLIGMSACYEDKGNYDYHPVNQITITGIEKEYQREKWDLLAIHPEFLFSQKETDQLAYRWEVDGRLVSQERDLAYDVDVNVSDGVYKCRMTVIHLADSSRYFQEFDLKVVTPFESGLMVLSEQEGKAMLSFRSDSYTTPDFLKWVFLSENGKNLEGKPLSLEQSFWNYNGEIFVTTSSGSYRLDQKLLKLLKRYDGNTMLVEEPDFEFKSCIFSDMADEYSVGCAIGTNGQGYVFRDRNNYFASPSPRPILIKNEEPASIDYELSDKFIITTMGFGSTCRFLGYDNLEGRFLYFGKGSPSDPDQLDRVYVRTPLIGLPILATGCWDYNKFGSFFYDPQTDVAKVVASHNATFSGVKDEALVTLTDHYFTSATILKFCDATGRAIYSSGSTIRQINMSNVTAPSTVLSDKLPEGAEITCLKFSSDRKRLYVGVLSDRSDEFRGDLYVLDAVSGAIIGEPYRGVGGKLVDVIEKF